MVFFFFTTVVPFSRMQFTTIRPRKRRHVLNDTSASITVHDVRKEIMRQFEQFMPLKYCKSREKVCPAGNLVSRALFPEGQKDHVAGGDERE